jgi:hypothetical protein
MRFLRLVLATSLLSVCASAAIAAVHVRVAVDPQVIPQCSRAHFLFALGNDGTSPIGVRVGIALLHDGQVIAGPFTLMTRLAAGQRRSHEFDFFVPSLVPTGQYAFAARAQATDGSSDASLAPFEVVASACTTPGNNASPTDDLLRQILNGLGYAPTGVDSRPWGAVKELYR